MWIKPFGIQQATLNTYLLSFIRNKKFQREANRSKNPCAEIVLPNMLDSRIYQDQILKWVGEPGYTKLQIEHYNQEVAKCKGRAY